MDTALDGAPIVTRIGDQEIHALEYGSGEVTLLLLHGLSGSREWWGRNVHDFAKDFHVLVPDLIGFGRSRPIRALPDLERIGLLVLEWLEVQQVQRAVLVGHSMGGQISVHMAARAPERFERMVLVDAAGIPRALSLRSLLRFAAEVGPMWRWGDPTFLPTIARDAWLAGPRVLLRAIQNIVTDDVRPLLPEIRLPTLIVWGEHDTLVPLGDAWQFRRLIPGSRLAVLRSAGHNPMVDRPADFNRLVRRFVDGEPIGR